MKTLFLFAVLLLAGVYAQVDQIPCTVLCPPAPTCDSHNSCPYYDLSSEVGSCCPQCCPSSCVNCFVDPCANYVCASNPELTCYSNYCGGCNRLWYSEENFLGYVSCDEEAFGVAAPAEDDDFTTLDDDDLVDDLQTSENFITLDGTENVNDDANDSDTSKTFTNSAAPIVAPVLLVLMLQILF